MHKLLSYNAYKDIIFLLHNLHNMYSTDEKYVIIYSMFMIAIKTPQRNVSKKMYVVRKSLQMETVNVLDKELCIIYS